VAPDDALRQAVETVVRRCLGVAPGEQALVVADGPSARLGELLRAEAVAAGADAVLASMTPRANDGAEPPAPVAAALAAADVFIAPASRSLSHTDARRRATEAGARGATLPGVTEEMLGRLMSVDFAAMQRRCRAVADLLTDADEARVTCPRGTDLTLDLRGRTAISDDGDLTGERAFGNLPCGEGFVAPGGGEGVLMAKTFANGGMADEPERVTVRGGRVTEAEGALGAGFLAALDAHGDLARTVAELGVGTNEHARLGGNVLEDEKILGTVHVAFGASQGIGGTVQVPIHLDLVILDASLEIGSRRVLDAGRWVL
jgi:leucyl aminopeptidase (aminopeptidase T)